MWKINNNKNKEILDKFRFKLIEPLFKEMIEYKKNKLSQPFIKYIEEGKQVRDLNSQELIIYICKIQKKHKKFQDVVQEILDSICYRKIQYIYDIYIYQNEEINKGNYNILEEKSDKIFEVMFSKFFYETFFDYKKIWHLIYGKDEKEIEFNRKKFHLNFKAENKIEICPYCDMETTINLSNNYIEHFLPRNKYPLLSMNANNLVSSCGACNTASEGKGTEIYLPISSPFKVQNGDKIKFTHDLSRHKIMVSSDIVEEQNYIKLFHLNERYGAERVYNIIKNKACSIYDSLVDIENISKVNISQKEVMDYIDKKNTRFAKKEPFCFAMKYIFRSYELYSLYKKRNNKL